MALMDFLGSWVKKGLTTKDTKVHEGKHLELKGWISFVYLRVLRG